MPPGSDSSGPPRQTDGVDRTSGRRRAGPDGWRGLGLVCAAGIIWGTIGPAVDLVHEWSSLSVLAIGAYRAVIAMLALTLAVLVTGRGAGCLALLRAHPGRVATAGVMTATFQLLFFVSVVASGVSIATVVCLGFAPVLLLVIGSVQRRRPPGRSRLLTVAAAVVGLLLVSLAGGGQPHAAHPVVGILTALGSGTAYALSAEVGAPLSRGHHALAVATATMGVAALVLVPGGLSVALLRGDVLRSSDPGAWLLLGYLGVVTMAIAYVLLFAGLRTTASGTAVVATLLEPVTAVAIAVLLLGETLTVEGAAGCVLILAAIATLGRGLEPPEPQ